MTKLFMHRDLTQEARNIIGDEVEYAYSTISQDDIDRGRSIDPSATFQLNSIQPGDTPVIVKMKNGKIFEIWVTESGGIDSRDTDDDIEEF